MFAATLETAASIIVVLGNIMFAATLETAASATVVLGPRCLEGQHSLGDMPTNWLCCYGMQSKLESQHSRVYYDSLTVHVTTVSCCAAALPCSWR